MTTLYEGAFAKVNLTLDVLGKREDGYHDLQSVMQTISIRDDVEIDVGTEKPWVLECSREDIPCGPENLAWKAAKVFCDSLKIDPNGLAIRITKRIPSGAGLGGGSADAAAVLRALNRHFDSPLSILALAELGARVGSDVPFCVVGGTAMVEGRASGCGSSQTCRSACLWSASRSSPCPPRSSIRSSIPLLSPCTRTTGPWRRPCLPGT